LISTGSSRVRQENFVLRRYLPGFFQAVFLDFLEIFIVPQVRGTCASFYFNEKLFFPSAVLCLKKLVSHQV
jgi:hypothetical protein